MYSKYLVNNEITINNLSNSYDKENDLKAKLQEF